MRGTIGSPHSGVVWYAQYMYLLSENRQYDTLSYMKLYVRRNRKAFFIVLLLALTLPLTYGLAQKAVELITGAAFKPAAFVIAADQPSSPIRRIWRGVAQGHEVSAQRLDTTVPFLKRAGIAYVRIDHLYDGFGVVDRRDGRLTYDWTKLDALVDDIVAAGALPYFSLSYMPPAISKSDILDLPNEWGEWGQVVAATVGHYSRDYRGGLANVIYEVWNEPDLFGGWKMYGNKSYTTLYTVASNAAVGVRGTKPFKIGGPATTGFYPAWVDGFYSKLDETTRIDFFSWHRYSADVNDFVEDVTSAHDKIAPLISRAQDLYISEWGVNAERGSGYDSRWGGAHFLAVITALESTAIDMALAFEVQDGVQGEQQYHGGWGMLTNPKYGAVVAKPRFKALEMVNKLSGNTLPLAGQGDYVTGMAAIDEVGTIRVLAVNYDKNGRHEEVFPLTLSGMEDVSYTVTEEYLSGRSLKSELVATGGLLRRDVALPASDAVLFTITKK